MHADTVDTHPWAGSRGSSAGLGECVRLAPSCAGLEGLPGRGKLSTDVKERGLLGDLKSSVDSGYRKFIFSFLKNA